MHTELDDSLQNSTQASEGGSTEQSSQSAIDIRQWSSTRLGGVWKSALSAVLKGWVRQEIVTQFKLAIPIVSIYVVVSIGNSYYSTENISCK